MPIRAGARKARILIQTDPLVDFVLTSQMSTPTICLNGWRGKEGFPHEQRFLFRCGIHQSQANSRHNSRIFRSKPRLQVLP